MNSYRFRIMVRRQLITETITSKCLATAINKLEVKYPHHRILDIEDLADGNQREVWAMVVLVIALTTVACLWIQQ